MRGRSTWWSRKHEERSKAPGPDEVGGDVVAALSEHDYYALLPNWCSADCEAERVRLVFTSPQQRHGQRGATGQPMTCVVVGPHWGLLGIHINSRHFKRTEDFWLTRWDGACSIEHFDIRKFLMYLLSRYISHFRWEQGVECKGL